MTSRTDGLAEIFRANGEMEAELVRSLLDSCGIDSIIAGGSFRLTQGYTLNRPGLVRVLVRAEDADRAAEVLESSFEPFRDFDSDDGEIPD